LVEGELRPVVDLVVVESGGDHVAAVVEVNEQPPLTGTGNNPIKIDGDMTGFGVVADFAVRLLSHNPSTQRI
jgi:hypothetical protein